MKLICLIKFVPDVDKFKFDFENNTVVRNNIRMILNPEDSKALGFALMMKDKDSSINVEAITMGPQSIMPLVEDLVRVGVSKVHMLCDSKFAGSDSYATSKTIGTYLKELSYDCILTGTHAIDGDTSHVPSQVAEFLQIGQMSNVISIDEESFNSSIARITVDSDSYVSTYEMALPGVISLNKDSKYKLPYIKRENMNCEVKEKIIILTSKDLKLSDNQLGIKGSLTKVNRTFVKEYEIRNKKLLENNEEGIEKVFQFLKINGYLEDIGE